MILSNLTPAMAAITNGSITVYVGEAYPVDFSKYIVDRTKNKAYDKEKEYGLQHDQIANENTKISNNDKQLLRNALNLVPGTNIKADGDDVLSQIVDQASGGKKSNVMSWDEFLNEVDKQKRWATELGIKNIRDAYDKNYEAYMKNAADLRKALEAVLEEARKLENTKPEDLIPKDFKDDGKQAVTENANEGKRRESENQNEAKQRLSENNAEYESELNRLESEYNEKADKAKEDFEKKKKDNEQNGGNIQSPWDIYKASNWDQSVLASLGGELMPAGDPNDPSTWQYDGLIVEEDDGTLRILKDGEDPHHVKIDTNGLPYLRCPVCGKAFSSDTPCDCGKVVSPIWAQVWQQQSDSRGTLSKLLNGNENPINNGTIPSLTRQTMEMDQKDKTAIEEFLGFTEEDYQNALYGDALKDAKNLGSTAWDKILGNSKSESDKLFDKDNIFKGYYDKKTKTYNMDKLAQDIQKRVSDGSMSSMTGSQLLAAAQILNDSKGLEYSKYYEIYGDKFDPDTQILLKTLGEKQLQDPKKFNQDIAFKYFMSSLYQNVLDDIKKNEKKEKNPYAWIDYITQGNKNAETGKPINVDLSDMKSVLSVIIDESAKWHDFDDRQTAHVPSREKEVQSNLNQTSAFAAVLAADPGTGGTSVFYEAKKETLSVLLKNMKETGEISEKQYNQILEDIKNERYTEARMRLGIDKKAEGQNGSETNILSSKGDAAKQFKKEYTKLQSDIAETADAISNTTDAAEKEKLIAKKQELDTRREKLLESVHDGGLISDEIYEEIKKTGSAKVEGGQEQKDAAVEEAHNSGVITDEDYEEYQKRRAQNGAYDEQYMYPALDKFIDEQRLKDQTANALMTGKQLYESTDDPDIKKNIEELGKSAHAPQEDIDRWNSNPAGGWGDPSMYEFHSGSVSYTDGKDPLINSHTISPTTFYEWYNGLFVNQTSSDILKSIYYFITGKGDYVGIQKAGLQNDLLPIVKIDFDSEVWDDNSAIESEYESESNRMESEFESEENKLKQKYIDDDIDTGMSETDPPSPEDELDKNPQDYTVETNKEEGETVLNPEEQKNLADENLNPQKADFNKQAEEFRKALADLEVKMSNLKSEEDREIEKIVMDGYSKDYSSDAMKKLVQKYNELTKTSEGRASLNEMMKNGLIDSFRGASGEMSLSEAEQHIQNAIDCLHDYEARHTDINETISIYPVIEGSQRVMDSTSEEWEQPLNFGFKAVDNVTGEINNYTGNPENGYIVNFIASQEGKERYTLNLFYNCSKMSGRIVVDKGKLSVVAKNNANGKKVTIYTKEYQILRNDLSGIKESPVDTIDLGTITVTVLPSKIPQAPYQDTHRISEDFASGNS